jgi:hypothetical protein
LTYGQRALSWSNTGSPNRKRLPRNIGLGIASATRNLPRRNFAGYRKLSLKTPGVWIGRNVQTRLNGRCGRTVGFDGLLDLPRTRRIRNHVIDHPKPAFDERSDSFFV